MADNKRTPRGVVAGSGMALGAGLGLLLGLLLSGEIWTMVAIGVVAGLLVGAIIDLRSAR
jgi:hypothetical protein